MKYLLISFIALLLSVSFAEAAVITPFSSPESSYRIIFSYISGAQKSAYLAVYTFTSQQLAEGLAAASGKGVDVKLIVDANPVGDKINKALLCGLENSGIGVYLYSGPGRYMHAKYIIRDNTSIAISSENFGSDGFFGNRGWGAVIDDLKTSKLALDVYLDDLKVSKRLGCEKGNGIASNRQNADQNQVRFEDQEARLVVAPDAVDEIVSLINSSKKSLYIEQFYIYPDWRGKPNKFLEASIEKAREGVDVKIILDSNGYSLDPKDKNSNFYTARYINMTASKEKIPIEVRLIDLKKLKLTKVHNKGVIVDNHTTLVSSVNWNENSPRKNREMGIEVSGGSTKYFLDKFIYDWDNSMMSSSPISGKAILRDYSGIGMKMGLFIAVSLAGMFAIKRKFYKNRWNGHRL